MSSQWRLAFHQEIELARRYRLVGDEQKARVCARRAAGIGASEFLSQHEHLNQPRNRFESLMRLASMEDLPDNARDVVITFLTHVDGNHRLPPGIDLIENAVNLITLLGITDEN